MLNNIVSFPNFLKAKWSIVIWQFKSTKIPRIHYYNKNLKAIIFTIHLIYCKKYRWRFGHWKFGWMTKIWSSLKVRTVLWCLDVLFVCVCVGGGNCDRNLGAIQLKNKFISQLIIITWWYCHINKLS